MRPLALNVCVYESGQPVYSESAFAHDVSQNSPNYYPGSPHTDIYELERLA